MKNFVFILTTTLSCLLAACSQATSNGAEPPNSPPSAVGQIMCPQDAMQCPDGTYVGRSGDKCEFVCPETPKK